MIIRFLLLLLLLCVPPAAAVAQFPTIPGRIAISADGNNHDCDDIAATPMSLTLLARSGNASKLVYYGHSDHHWSSNTVETCGPGTSDREAVMQDGVEDTMALWGGFSSGIIFNARANTAGAVAALVTQINASSAGNPLWIIAAGPMDIVGQALNTAGANKDHVTVISHSEWNDDHADNPEGGETSHSGWTWTEMQAANATVTFTHIADQNAGLNVNESNYTWTQNSYDSRLTWLWDRHITSGETPFFDPSDAGMVYWLITGGGGAGDEGATPRKVRFIIEPNVYPAHGGAWDTATPAEMGFDAGAFATALAACPDRTIVIRNGYIVGTKGDVTLTGLTWSASKSLTSLIYARQLYLHTVNHDDAVPSSDFPSAPTATYRQFLSMTSDYGLNQPSHAPGSHFAYNNGAVHHYGTHLKTTFYAGRTHAQTLADAYVTALGFQDAFDYPDNPPEGPNFMSGWNGGWTMSTRDMARITYLVLRGGVWKGKRILSARFIDDLYSGQIPGAATASTDEDDDFYNQPGNTAVLNGNWSYGFWTNFATPNGTSVSMQGRYGTVAIVVRPYNLIIAYVNIGGTGTPTPTNINLAQVDAIIASISTNPPNPYMVCGWTNATCR